MKFFSIFNESKEKADYGLFFNKLLLGWISPDHQLEDSIFEKELKEERSGI